MTRYFYAIVFIATAIITLYALQSIDLAEFVDCDLQFIIK